LHKLGAREKMSFLIKGTKAIGRLGRMNELNQMRVLIAKADDQLVKLNRRRKIPAITVIAKTAQ
jgi:hypothetical protein